jgi:hypothetical protein
MDNFILGVADDPRPPEAKAKDWHFDEVATAIPVNWVEKTFKDLRFFSRRDQDGSGSCMAQSGAKVLGIENVVEENLYNEMSATPLYQARANKPTTGMWQQDCLSLMCKPVVCFESQVPSQKMSDAQMDAPYTITADEVAIAEEYRASGYAFIPIDIDKVASVVAEGKAVQLLMYFKADEWWGQTDGVPKILHPELTNMDVDALRHGIAAVDYLLHIGEKSLGIEDSAVLPTENGQRILTNTFFKQRCYGAGYLLPLSNNHSIINKPQYTFTKQLTYGMTDPDIVALQNILKFEGYFTSTIPSTGYFGPITAQALQKWQVAHNILDFQNVTDLTKIRFGSKSLTLANSLYAK